MQTSASVIRRILISQRLSMESVEQRFVTPIHGWSMIRTHTKVLVLHHLVYVLLLNLTVVPIEDMEMKKVVLKFKGISCYERRGMNAMFITRRIWANVVGADCHMVVIPVADECRHQWESARKLVLLPVSTVRMWTFVNVVLVLPFTVSQPLAREYDKVIWPESDKETKLGSAPQYRSITILAWSWLSSHGYGVNSV
jgi:hypothetical protein